MKLVRHLRSVSAFQTLLCPALQTLLCPAHQPGPFTTVEMCEWFQAGYFTMTLLVKRGCDEGFQPLGDVIKMWGRVPFAPGPSPPPLLVRQLPPTQRPQPNRGPAGTVSQSSATLEDGEGRMQMRGHIYRQVMVAGIVILNSHLLMSHS